MPKKSLVTGESANLYDPDTGAYVGVVDKAGKETMVATVDVNQVTGGINLLVGTDAVISSGTDAPNDADGKPDGSIYFQI